MCRHAEENQSMSPYSVSLLQLFLSGNEICVYLLVGLITFHAVCRVRQDVDPLGMVKGYIITQANAIFAVCTAIWWQALVQSVRPSLDWCFVCSKHCTPFSVKEHKPKEHIGSSTDMHGILLLLVYYASMGALVSELLDWFLQYTLLCLSFFVP